MHRQGVCHRRVSRQCEKGQTIYTREKRVRTTHIVQRIKNEEENKESKATRNKSRALLPK